MHRKRFLPDLSVRASNEQGLRGPHWPRSLLQPGSTTRAWVRKSSPNTIVLGVRLRAGTRAVAMGRSWGLRVSSLLLALRLTLELPKASATTPLAQKRRIYVLPFFNLPCMYDTQSTLRTITSKNSRYILSMVHGRDIDELKRCRRRNPRAQELEARARSPVIHL